MITQSDGSVLYTTEERNETAQAQFNKGVEITKDAIGGVVLHKFRDYVQGSTDEEDKVDMLNLYNDIAGSAGFNKVTTLCATYTVLIEYNGYTVGEFTGIEAEDDDAAIEEVRDNMVLEADITFNISYNNDSCNETVNMDFDAYELEFSAIEE